MLDLEDVPSKEERPQTQVKGLALGESLLGLTCSALSTRASVPDTLLPMSQDPNLFADFSVL